MSEEWNEVNLSPTAPEKEKIEFEVEGQEENESVDVASEPVQVEAEAAAKPSTEPAQDAEEGFEPAEAQTDSELKGLIELFIQKLNFDFGHKVNIEIANRFFKVEGKPYNVGSLGKCNYRVIVDNVPKNSIYTIVDETAKKYNLN